MSSAPQTSVDTPQVGLPGAPADASAADENVVRTYVNEEASAHIPFGRICKLGTADAGGTGTNGAKVPSAQADKLIGFSSFALGFNRTTELDATGVLPKTHFGITEKGVLWIMPEADMVPGDAVHARVTTNVAKLPGMIGPTSDTTKTVDISKYCQVRTKGGPTSGQPIKLAFDFTMAATGTSDS